MSNPATPPLTRPIQPRKPAAARTDPQPPPQPPHPKQSPPKPFQPGQSKLDQSQPGQSQPGQSQPGQGRRPRRWLWLVRWQLWGSAMVLLFTWAGYKAAISLVELPGNANCSKLFLPLASAANRLACAQAAADRGTVQGFVEAIAMMRDLPADHPMRNEINRYIAQWSEGILRLAEEAFNQGQLSDAIAMAQKVPQAAPNFKQVQEKISEWRKIWDEAETIYRLAQNEIRHQNWGPAFSQAIRLLTVGNTYWATVKYRELNEQIEASREGGNRLVRARKLMNEGGVTNLLAALELLRSVEKTSPLYQDCQSALGEVGERLFNLAQERLDNQDFPGAMALLRKIPASMNLQAEIQDFSQLARLQSQTWKGGVAELQGAIAEAQKIDAKRPLYGRAQQLISRWQLEIEAVTRLDNARQLARSGRVQDLNAAIAEAQGISRNNPRWSEVEQEVRRWQNQVEAIADRPILDIAEQLAAPGTIAALQAAIDQAGSIGKDRTLYQQAQTKIQDWTRQIQTIEDQPILDRALSLASRGNIPDAVATAELIQPGRALFDKAQSTIKTWRTNAQSTSSMDEARRLANSGTTEGVVNAIRTANRIPEGSPMRAEANDAVNQWSQLMLDTARERAKTSVQEAIVIADQIPPRTEAYAAAQVQIAEWKRAVQGR